MGGFLLVEKKSNSRNAPPKTCGHLGDYTLTIIWGALSWASSNFVTWATYILWTIYVTIAIYGATYWIGAAFDVLKRHIWQRLKVVNLHWKCFHKSNVFWVNKNSCLSWPRFYCCIKYYEVIVKGWMSRKTHRRIRWWWLWSRCRKRCRSPLKDNSR